MATISEITGAANYLGNPALGGYIPTAIEIDTKPLQTLAAYTVMQNKSLFDQRQKDADEQILELANITQFDAANAVPKDKEEVTRYVSEYMQKAKERAQQGLPKSPSEKLSNKFKWESETMLPVEKIKAANARGLARVKQLADIDNSATLNPETKKILRDEIDRQFNETGLSDPIPSLSKFTPSLPKTGLPIYSQIQTNAKDANGNYEGKFEFFNPKSTHNQSILETTGMDDTLPPNATSDQKLNFALRQAQGGTKKVWDDMGVSFNTAVSDERYKLKGADGVATGEIDVEALQRDIPFVGNLYAAIDKFNEYNRQGKEDARNGNYSTKAGKNVDILNVVKESDFFEIDKTKALTPAELNTLQKYLVANPIGKEEKYTFTGEGIRKQGIGVDWYQAKTGRINATRPTASASAGGGADAAAGSNQSALIFGKHVNDLKQRFAANPGQNIVISYNGIDPVTKKALGIAVTDNVGFVTYSADGTVRIGSDEKGVGGVPMTIEQQKFNFVSAVKGGSKDEAQLDAKFIEEQENGFRATLGTTDGTFIWNNWGVPQTAAAASTAPTPNNTKTVNGKKLILPQ